jgi:hypothetical protein
MTDSWCSRPIRHFAVGLLRREIGEFKSALPAWRIWTESEIDFAKFEV